MAGPTYFRSGAEFRKWLERNHDKEPEVIVGYYRVGVGKPTMTWAESVDEALCFGWIDGVRRGVDDERYTIRFTPRRPASKWSAVNIEKVAKLTAEGRMRPEGWRVFDERVDKGPGYSYESATSTPFDAATEGEFRAAKQAWEFFEAQPPGYKRTATHWVMSAKRAETRARRLAQLIEDSQSGQRLGQFRR